MCELNNIFIDSHINLIDEIIKVLKLPEHCTSIFMNNCTINEIYFNKNIKYIDCENNKIQNIIFHPDSHQIITINLKDNLLTKFEHQLPESTLYLDLRNNKIKEITCKLPKLFELNISGNENITIKYLDFMFKDNIAPDQICMGDYLQILFPDDNIWSEYYIAKLFDKIILKK
jgi:Leucine-rich repeat (LRR) protein